MRHIFMRYEGGLFDLVVWQVMAACAVLALVLL